MPHNEGSNASGRFQCCKGHQAVLLLGIDVGSDAGKSIPRIQIAQSEYD